MGVFSEMGVILGLSTKPSVSIFESDERSYSVPTTESPLEEKSSESEKKATTGTTTVVLNTSVLHITDRDVQNYINNNITRDQDIKKSKNPYVEVLEHFSENGPGGKNSLAKRLRTSDFIYLMDIGVYPINRMVILKRFGTNSPSYDLNDHDLSRSAKMGQSTSTVVGWVKNDSDFFDFSFNEVWKTQSKWLHEVIREIIQQQFGTDIGSIFPLPGWGQGLMFKLMERFGGTGIQPMGNPNLLREGVTRETDSTGLNSNLSFKLETVYEMKYVNGVDPSLVFHNTIQNLMNMGTSDMEFLFKNSATIRNIEKMANDPNINNLKALLSDLVTTAVNMISEQITNLKSKLKAGKDAISKEIKTAAKNNAQDKTNIENQDKAVSAGKGKEIDYVNSNGETVKWKPDDDYYNKAVKEHDSRVKKEKETTAVQAITAKLSSAKNKILDWASTLDDAMGLSKMIKSGINSILSMTISRYKWPLLGAINQSTGSNNTPWHLTIGNPMSPILSMSNIKVSNVSVKLGSELLFNDLPKFIYVTINIEQARNLGKQEMLRMFGVKFKRDYSTTYKSLDDYNKVVDEESKVVKPTTPPNIKTVLNPNITPVDPTTYITPKKYW